MSRLKLDGIQELEDSPQTAATELNDKEINSEVLTLRTLPEMNNFLFLSSKQNITQKAGGEQCIKYLETITKNLRCGFYHCKLNMKAPM